MYWVYILFSKKLEKHYIGSTSYIENRLAQHTEDPMKGSFTSKADDWKLIFNIECQSPSQGLRIEEHIKSMKSRKYIQNLCRYPEMVEKLLKRYQ
ncbi:MAG: GIY-YIG nuclease family protein [Cyclobacteriaceae bacterium]|nr:GIY-YIG nuclease family protein [Cyclobacteriaceae bacterium]